MGPGTAMLDGNRLYVCVCVCVLGVLPEGYQVRLLLSCRQGFEIQLWMWWRLKICTGCEYNHKLE